jgi:hypothetical protein
MTVSCESCKAAPWEISGLWLIELKHFQKNLLTNKFLWGSGDLQKNDANFAKMYSKFNFNIWLPQVKSPSPDSLIMGVTSAPTFRRVVPL